MLKKPSTPSNTKKREGGENGGRGYERTAAEEDKMNTKEQQMGRLRSYLNLSQAAFGKPLGISPMQIGRYEKGISPIPPSLISLICSTFQVDPRYFDGEMAVENAVSVVTEDEKNIQIGARLKAAREEKGWTQKELAERSGVDRTVINRVEFGAYLTEKQGRKLAEALEVGFQWLMSGDTSRRDYPADQKLVDWLWENVDVRRELWERMKSKSSEKQGS